MEEAQRAAMLTRQLLLFGRRSVMDSKVLDLNALVENLLKMLRRLIGEHVELTFQGQIGLLLLKADAGMIEQVIMNLTVNARDAMPDGGRITITAASVEVSENATWIEKTQANRDLRGSQTHIPRTALILDGCITKSANEQRSRTSKKAAAASSRTPFKRHDGRRRQQCFSPSAQSITVSASSPRRTMSPKRMSSGARASVNPPPTPRWVVR